MRDPMRDELAMHAECLEASGASAALEGHQALHYSDGRAVQGTRLAEGRWGTVTSTLHCELCIL